MEAATRDCSDSVPAPAGVVLGAATLLLPASLCRPGRRADTRRFRPTCRRRRNCRACRPSGQLSGGAPCRHRARRRRGRRLLPRGAARRSEEPRAARARLPVGAGRRRGRRGGQARRPGRQGRQERPHRAAGARRARAQAEAIYAVAQAESDAVGARADHRSGRDLLAAWASYGAGDAKAAIEAIDKLQGPTGTRCSRTCTPA